MLHSAAACIMARLNASTLNCVHFVPFLPLIDLWSTCGVTCVPLTVCAQMIFNLPVLSGEPAWELGWKTANRTNK